MVQIHGIEACRAQGDGLKQGGQNTFSRWNLLHFKEEKPQRRQNHKPSGGKKRGFALQSVLFPMEAMFPHVVPHQKTDAAHCNQHHYCNIYQSILAESSQG